MVIIIAKQKSYVFMLVFCLFVCWLVSFSAIRTAPKLWVNFSELLGRGFCNLLWEKILNK